MEKGKYNILNFILYKEIKMLKEKLLNDLKVAMKEKNVNKKNDSPQFQAVHWDSGDNLFDR